MKNSVIALDLSPSDNKILSYLADNRTALGLEKIHFVHILPEKLSSYPGVEGLWEPWSKEDMNLVFKRLREQVGQYFQLDKDKIEFHISKGDPLSELLDCAESVDADLVAIGQKSGVKKHGVMAKNFIRNVKCAGLVIPEDRPDDLSHILVPVDFSPYAGKSLKEAVNRAKKSDKPIKITALHVYELPALGFYKLSLTERKFGKTIKANILDSLQKFIQSQVPEDAGMIDVKAVSRGVPGVANYISEYAFNINADFIIMGAKGHSKIKLLLMGSVAEAILSSNTFIPTLIVR